MLSCQPRESRFEAKCDGMLTNSFHQLKARAINDIQSLKVASNAGEDVLIRLSAG
jgi:hypothetical protein